MLVVMNAILTIPINFNAHKARELLYVVVCVCAMHGYVRANAGCVHACVHVCEMYVYVMYVFQHV